MKKELTPGNTYTVEEFDSTLRKAKIAKDRFLKENRLSKEDTEKIVEIVGDHQNIYNYFNKQYNPFDIEIKEIGEDKEEVKSNNIYDRMAARTITHYTGSFKIKISYNDPPITVTRNFSKDTTLSMRDIVSFM